MNDQPELPGALARCLRCDAQCRLGVPDPKARAIRVADTSRACFCANCVVTRFLLSIEVIANLIEGTPQRGSEAAGVIVAAREALGPEVFLNGEWMDKTLRPIMAGILAHTQLREDQINWIEVVGNWGLPWPKGHQPAPTEY